MPEKKTTKKVTPKKELQSPLDSEHLFSAVAYIGVLFIIPLLTHQDSEYVQFHVKQGIVLFAIEFVSLLLLFTVILAPLTPILLLLAFAASGYGMVCAATGKKAAIPGAQWLITHLNI